MGLREIIETAKDSELVDQILDWAKDKAPEALEEALSDAQADVEDAARDEVKTQSEEIKRMVLVIGVILVLLMVRR